MSKCPRCKHEITPLDQTCPGCGVKLHWKPHSPSAAPAKPTQTPAEASSKETAASQQPVPAPSAPAPSVPEGNQSKVETPPVQASPAPQTPENPAPDGNGAPAPAPSPKFCPQCGIKLESGTKFCPGCGTTVEGKNTAMPPSRTSPPAANPPHGGMGSNPAKRGIFRKTWMKVAAILTLIALAGGILWIVKSTIDRSAVATAFPGGEPGETKTITLPGGATMEMVWCPPGTFLMGSPMRERRRENDETQHQVTLTKGFWMAKTEVTQKQWKGVMGNNPSEEEGDDLPVENVAWDDVQQFCEKTGLQLPTEAQWEYACRAGSTGAYAGTEDLYDEARWHLGEIGWFYDNSGFETHPVEENQPNAWGLHDMHGNVDEWCQDWYGDYPVDAVSDPQGPSSGSDRVTRGGSRKSFDYECRSAYRGYMNPFHRHETVGFRPVLNMPAGAETKAAVTKAKESEAKAKVEEEARSTADASAAIARAKAEIAAMQTGERTGETKTIPLPGGATMEMVWCPPGTFMMGSPEDEAFREDDETQHQVTLTKGFWMAKTEVTQAQWNSMMGNNPSYYVGDNLPVENVSWDDCQEFCEETGLQLPTEAQWEYACRAGSTGDFAGIGKLDEMGWYRNSGYKTHPVGQKQPNAWGLYDMYGNVSEWCQDWYGDYPVDAVSDPQGPSSGSDRVTRGGSWVDDAYYGGCRSACRGAAPPSYVYRNLGFRPVMNLSAD